MAMRDLIKRLSCFLGISGDYPLSFAMRERTIKRNNAVHELHERILDDLGELRGHVSMSYIYGKIAERFDLSQRQISRILYHTKKERLYD